MEPYSLYRHVVLLDHPHLIEDPNVVISLISRGIGGYHLFHSNYNPINML